MADLEAGLRVRHRQGQLAVECLLPGSYRPAEPVTLSLEALAELEGRDDAPAVLEATGPGRTVARWADRGIPRARGYDAADPGPPAAWPAPAGILAPAPAGLLEALVEASAVAAEDAGSRYDLACLLLRGEQGEVAATDGRQLLVRHGLPLPWAGDRPVRRSPIFARLAALDGGPVELGATDAHVVLRAGPWTAWLAVQAAARLPRLEGVLPPPSAAATRLVLDPADARFLLEALPRLPGADGPHAPVTIECNGRIAVRACDAGGRVTELVLARSRHSGPDVRLASDRGPLGRALRLGHTELLIDAPGQPVACRSGERTFGWQPLSPESALGPSEDALRIDSAAASRPARAAGAASPHPPDTDPSPRTTMTRPTPERTQPAEATDRPAGLGELIAEAQALHAALGEARSRAGRLAAALRRHRRRARLMESTLATLKQLRLAEAAG